MVRKEPDEEFNDLTDGVDTPIEKEAIDVVGAEAMTQKKTRAPRLSGQLKEIVAARVATFDQLGFTKREGAAMITSELYPNGEGVFTPKQYVHWLNHIKAAKLSYFDYYSRTGVVLDTIDINETLKMTYQNCLRQFRMECVKKEKQDKSYIIKLGYLIKDLAELRQQVIFSVPFVHSYKHVIDKTKGVLDAIQEHYPSLIEVSNTGDTIVRIPKSKSRNAGNGKKVASQGVDEEEERAESGTGSTEGNVQSDADNRAVSQVNGTAGTAASERIFG